MAADVPHDNRDDGRPWEQPGAVRRDCRPHGGKLLQALGGVALGCCIFALILPVGLVALPLGAAVWRMAAWDLAAMTAGRVDPAGRAATARAHYRARVAVFLSVFGLGIDAAVVLVALGQGLP
jgi:hypothetical protein